MEPTPTSCRVLGVCTTTLLFASEPLFTSREAIAATIQQNHTTSFLVCLKHCRNQTVQLPHAVRLYLETDQPDVLVERTREVLKAAALE